MTIWLEVGAVIVNGTNATISQLLIRLAWPKRVFDAWNSKILPVGLRSKKRS